MPKTKPVDAYTIRDNRLQVLEAIQFASINEHIALFEPVLWDSMFTIMFYHVFMVNKLCTRFMYISFYNVRP